MAGKLAKSPAKAPPGVDTAPVRLGGGQKPKKNPKLKTHRPNSGKVVYS
jgi:hypothetical protein